MGGDRKEKHRRHGRTCRMRRWFHHNKKYILFIAAVLTAAILCGGLWVRHMLLEQGSRHVTSGNSVNMGSGYRNITYNGKNYQYNSLITTVLYAGIDSEGRLEPLGTYTDAPRADTISLAIFNKKNGKMTVMSFSRDTMTEIRRYTVNGKDRGTYVSHLGLAYTYGDGGEVSCENLREAVSELLGGIPIDEYVVTNRSSLPGINALVGGVTVTVPGDELAELYPEFQKGATVTLDETNVEAYLRTRDTEEAFSNTARMEWQRSYMTAYMEKLQVLLQTNTADIWEKIQDMDDYLQTSITKNKYLSLASLLTQVSFDADGYYVPEGQDAEGELHDEFYVDEEALREKVIELFYEEV